VFFAIYVGAWAAFGILALGWQRLALRTIGIDARVLLASTLVVAAGWQLTRVKRRALLACRRTVPPAPHRPAGRCCARFALLQSRRCMASCWALMAVMVAVQQAAAVWMLSLSALMAAEELTRSGRRGGRLLPLSAAALAAVAGMVAFTA
jgi:predicted metal-binding membrane protein